MINEIFKTINKHLSGLHYEEIFYGLAETISRLQGTVEDKMPGIILDNGEIKFVGIDDVNSIIGYHKINNIALSQLANGFGDNMGDIRNLLNCSIFIYWNKSKIKTDPDEMLLIIHSRIPNIINNIPNAEQVVFRPINALINQYDIYKQEYSYTDQRPLPSNNRLLQLNYNIEITINPKCIPACPECISQ